VRFQAAEVVLLTMMFGDLLALLEPEDAGSPNADPLAELTGLDDAAPPVVRPSDPVLERLLPDAYADDAERSAEFRRFTEGELRSGKQAAVQAVLDSLPEGGGTVVLDEDLTQAWLTALNDLRLALGTRLDVTEDSYGELDRLERGSPRAKELTVFLWLGVLQESLVDTLL
jgi:hypothetical protein